MRPVPRLLDTGWERLREAPTPQRCGIAVFFAEPPPGNLPAATSPPFHLVIEPDGRVVQTAPLDRQIATPCSPQGTYLSIGCLGNYPEQRLPLLGACAGLILQAKHTFGWEDVVTLPTSPADPDPDDVQQLRRGVRNSLAVAHHYRFIWSHRDYCQSDAATDAWPPPGMLALDASLLGWQVGRGELL